MLRPIDNYYLQKEEPYRSCLQYLRSYILIKDPAITEQWRYGMPFYFYKGRRICYLWIHKKLRQPYLGIVDGDKVQHPDLLAEKRTRMKILLVDPNKNIPEQKINIILKAVLDLHK